MRKTRCYDEIFSSDEKEQIIKDYSENYLSIRELCKKYDIHTHIWLRKLLGNKIRSLSEANKVCHLKHPESFKQSDEAKEKIRAARLKFMREHPEQTAWRKRNMSYPEKCFKKILEDNGLDKKYLIYREYSVFPYFIDFAFVNEKLAVEIDGSQHLQEDRKKKDEEKDKLLLSKGWRVLRIAANEVTHDGTKALKSVADMLGDSTVKTTTVGILKAPKTRQKPTRNEDGLTDKQREKVIKQRKVERPSKEELFELVKATPFVKIAKMYGVSDKAITKWCKRYGLLHRKKDIDALINKEHKYAKKLNTCLYCGKEYYAYKINGKFCCNECYKKYIKEFGLVNKENRKKTYNWVYKLNEDGSLTNLRVTDEDLEKYINEGWNRGRVLTKK